MRVTGTLKVTVAQELFSAALRINIEMTELPARPAHALPSFWRKAMKNRPTRPTSIALAAALVLAPVSLLTPVLQGQEVTVTSSSSSTSDRWLHVRVIDTNHKGETVRVNVPLEMAEKVLPAINKDRLHSGKIQINHSEMEGVDLKALLEAVRSSKDGEYVTVQSNDNDVRVAKQAGYMVVHVTEKGFKSSKSDKSDKSADKSEEKSYERSRVDVKIPMKVVEALLSAGKDELDLVAALRALSAHGGDTELVSVKSDDSTVRVWLDSKNVSD
jgi:hypothetical protein